MLTPTGTEKTMTMRRNPVFVVALAALAATAARAGAAEPATGLADRERLVSRQMRELEATFLRLADLLAASDPRRAATLRSAFEQARETELTARLDTVVELLEQDQLLKASAGQETALDRLRRLLTLLEAGDSRRTVADSKKQVKEFLGRINQLIARQKGLEGTTEAGGDAEAIASEQEKVATDTRKLADDVEAFRHEAAEAEGLAEQKSGAGENAEASGKKSADGDQQQGQPSEDPAAGKPSDDEAGKPSESGKGEPSAAESQPGEPAGKPSNSDSEGEAGDPGQPEQQSAGQGSEQEPQGDDEAARAARTSRRLAEAESRMEQAQERLDQARRSDAREEQEKALAELEAARAELEEILRQLREEEIERLLVRLEARVRTMLRAERAVLRGLEQLADEKQALKPRERDLEAARLGREQQTITADATRALTLVRDDGSAVAIPEALEQIREDSLQAASRLKQGNAQGLTKGIVEDLVLSLEELLAALERAEREQQERQQQGQAGGRPAEPGEQPLVDKLAELKMIRTLQLRVNRRTSRFSQLLADDTEKAGEPGLVEALGRLADRQERVERAAHDIVTGRTE